MLASSDQLTNNTVHCYSGASYGERPVSFVLNGLKFTISTVISQQKTPDTNQFLVRTETNEIFFLTYNINKDDWNIETGYVPAIKLVDSPNMKGEDG